MKFTPDNLTCPICGGKMYLSQSEMASEHFDMYEKDEDALVYYFKCQKCGREFEITDPPLDEREGDYKDYWNTTYPTTNGLRAKRKSTNSKTTRKS